MPEHNPPMRAIIYARTAQDGQDGQHGALQQQVDECQGMARRLGAAVEATFTDSGIPGTTLQRTGLDALLAHVAAHPTAYVICSDQGRLSRSAAHLVKVILDLHEHHTAVALARTNTLLTVAPGKPTDADSPDEPGERGERVA